LYQAGEGGAVTDSDEGSTALTALKIPIWTARGRRGLVAVVFLGGLLPCAAAAQDLEPRALSPAPTGMNFAALAYGYSFGNVFFDTSVPIENADGKLHSMTAAYVRTLDFFGASAKAAGFVTYGSGDWKGDVEGEFRTTSRNGFADPAVKLAVNFIGAPAMQARDFVAYREGTVVGASLLVTIPVGQYYADKLINLGTNRWMLRPRIGASHAVGRWIFELYGEVKIITENDDFFGGHVFEQEPIWSLDGSVIYSIKPGMWLAVAAGFGRGGQTSVDGVKQDTDQKNSRLGAAFVLPLNQQHSLKFIFISGIKTKIGADFDLISLSYQYRWGGGI
jgi:hypothetical protein